MSWGRTGWRRWCRAAGICLLALMLCLRPATPAMAMAAPAPPGTVAICLGGQIVYVALPGLDLPGMADAGEETPGPRADPCPAFAFAAAPVPPAPLLRAPAVPAPLQRILQAGPARVVQRMRPTHPARAPPAPAWPLA